jgi:hypothetical protein
VAARVLVRHVGGGEKWVDESRLPSLSGRWSVVDPQPVLPKPKSKPSGSKRSVTPAAESTPAVVPDNDSQEG